MSYNEFSDREMGPTRGVMRCVAAYMVRRIVGPGANEQAVGQMIGMLAAASFFARCLVAYAWGIVSDTVGRKVRP